MYKKYKEKQVDKYDTNGEDDLPYIGAHWQGLCRGIAHTMGSKKHLCQGVIKILKIKNHVKFNENYQILYICFYALSCENHDNQWKLW